MKILNMFNYYPCTHQLCINVYHDKVQIDECSQEQLIYDKPCAKPNLKNFKHFSGWCVQRSEREIIPMTRRSIGTLCSTLSDRNIGTFCSENGEKSDPWHQEVLGHCVQWYRDVLFHSEWLKYWDVLFWKWREIGPLTSRIIGTLCSVVLGRSVPLTIRMGESVESALSALAAIFFSF